MCLLCHSEKPTRYIDLYVIGSEGLHICHECEIKVIKYCIEIMKENSEKKLESVKERKARDYWAEIIGVKNIISNQIKKPNVPCNRVLGHGESCVDGHLCEQCEYIVSLEGKKYD